MKLDQEPRISRGDAFYQSLLEWMRKVVQAGNESTDKVAQNTTDIAGKVNRAGDTMTGGLNLVTPSTSATEASSDNSTKIATTAWAKVGLASSFSGNGYLKLPDWLGGFIVQWGSIATGAGGVAVSFPLTFPTAVWSVTISGNVGGARMATYQSLSTGGFFAQCWDTAGAQQNTLVSWIAVGK